MNELETKTLPDGSRIERVRELVDEILLNMSDPTYTALHRHVLY